MITAAAIAYALCALVSAACAALLLRSWTRSRSRVTKWVGIAFVFLTASNVLLTIDLFAPADFSIVRPALIAAGLALLIYGVTGAERA